MAISQQEAVRQVLNEFISDRSKGIRNKRWCVIPKEQYKNLLLRYMDDPIKARIPDSVVSRWIDFVKGNVTAIKGIGLLWPRANETVRYDMDIDSANAFFGYKMNEIQMRKHLENLGFYIWAKYPDKKYGYSDEGIDELESILSEETPDMTAEEKLILINRCLNVVHPRNDLSMAFIDGGSETCTEISGQVHKN